MKMSKLIIKIQSISDIITNSSSETFCRICSEKHLKEIYETLKDIFPGDDPDYEPVLQLDTLEEDDREYSLELFEKIKPGEQYARLELPYSIWCPTFFQYGIEGILKEKFPNGDYTIIYNENC